MYDIIIIGAGVAGLTSALYALRARKKILILEAKAYGGQIINAHKVENYPGIESISGFDLATNLYKQVEKLGPDIKYETVLKVREDKTVITNKGEYNAKAVIIATGTTNKKLGIKNEDKYMGKGLSYCAICDGAFYKDKIVAVVGGGSTALEDTLYLADTASKVYLIHRRDEFRAEASYLKELKLKNNVEIVLNATIKELNGSDKLESITITVNEDNTQTINVDGVFIAIGQVPNNAVFANVVDFTEHGYIKAIDEVHTKTSGIYVAGDIKEKQLRQLTTAVSDGSIAAVTAIKELK